MIWTRPAKSVVTGQHITRGRFASQAGLASKAA
jgi:hypothetical protein